MKNDNKKPKNLWKTAINKFQHALGDNVDSVRVRISVDSDYLQEITKGKVSADLFGQIYDFPMLRMSESQLKERQIIYDQSKNGLINYNNELATTVGKISKGEENLQAFVMSKNGDLYIGTHEGQPVDIENPSLSHASFLKGKPAEMAGMLSINKGKIDLITNDSGHYAPEPLDMYRGIKKLPMNAFAENAKIAFHDGNSMSIKDFIQDMEQVIDGKSKYEILRDQRISKLNEYEKNLKNAVHIRFNTQSNDIINSIITLNNEEKEELKNGFKQPMMSLSTSDANGKYQNVNLAELVDDLIYKDRVDAMNVLLDAGIANRNWSVETHPLHKAITERKETMVEKMLANTNTQKFLEQEASIPGMSSLHIAASVGNEKMIEEILKYPESNNLLTKKDQHGLTPLDSAKKFKNTKAIDILTKAKQRMKFQNLLNSKEFKESVEQIGKNNAFKRPISSSSQKGANQKQSRQI